MPVGHELSDLCDDGFTYRLEGLVEFLHSSAFCEGHHGDFVLGYAASQVLVALEYLERVPEDIVLVAAVALGVIFGN